ncbi:MAG: transporter, partial [Pseudomonadota bacterium]
VGTTEFDYVQGEVFWQITPNEARWQHGLRFDWRVRGGDRPGFIGLNYMNQVDLLENLELRSVLLTAIEFGDDRRNGVLLETRNHLAYRVKPGLRVGVETFNVYGSTAGFRNFNKQRHQVGPFATIDLGGDWSVFAGGLFGVSDAGPDANGRFWLTRVF